MIDFQELPFPRWSRVVRSKARIERFGVVIWRHGWRLKSRISIDVGSCANARTSRFGPSPILSRTLDQPSSPLDQRTRGPFYQKFWKAICIYEIKLHVISFLMRLRAHEPGLTTSMTVILRYLTKMLTYTPDECLELFFSCSGSALMRLKQKPHFLQPLG